MVNAYPGGESPFYGDDGVLLICDICGGDWMPEDDYELYPDEDELTLQLTGKDAQCPHCGSGEFDWREVG